MKEVYSKRSPRYEDATSLLFFPSSRHRLHSNPSPSPGHTILQFPEQATKQIKSWFSTLRQRLGFFATLLIRPTNHHFVNGTTAQLQLLRSNSLSSTEMTLQYLEKQIKPALLFKHDNSDVALTFYLPSPEVLDISTLSFCNYPAAQPGIVAPSHDRVV